MFWRKQRHCYAPNEPYLTTSNIYWAPGSYQVLGSPWWQNSNLGWVGVTIQWGISTIKQELHSRELCAVVEEEESAVELIAMLAVGEQGGRICMHMVDSLCCTAETNNIVKQLYSNKNKVHRNISMEAIPMLESPACMLSCLSWVQLFLTLYCSLPGSSIHGILQARILEWIAISSSRGSSLFRDPTGVFCVSCIAGGFFTTSTIWEVLEIAWKWKWSCSVMSDSLRPHRL